MSRLDWNDPVAVRRWLVDVRVASDDADAVVQDMFARPRDRELGPATHRKTYRDARKTLVQLLAYAMPDGEPEPSGPNGGEAVQ